MIYVLVVTSLPGTVAMVWTLLGLLLTMTALEATVPVPKSGLGRVLNVVDALKSSDEDSSYNQSQAFKSWLNNVLQTYDNRVRPFFGGK